LHLTALAARRDYLARKVADPDLAGRKVYLKHEIAALEFVVAVLTPIVQSVRADDPAVDRQNPGCVESHIVERDLRSIRGIVIRSNANPQRLSSPGGCVALVV
jgi:hypothetical protein